jgi:hypothetical protein
MSCSRIPVILRRLFTFNFITLTVHFRSDLCTLI